MSVRPSATVYDVKDGKTVPAGSVKIPAVFGTRVRNDIVKDVYNRLQLSKRQPYAVKDEAGYETAALSWGTGRAVARVPRVPGSGTHRSGQAAFANFCRGGGMFGPTKVWRKWTRDTNRNTRLHAQAFCYSAAGCTSLVASKGHKIQAIPELPLVVTNRVNDFEKTRDLNAFLQNLGCGEELQRCVDNRGIRAGRGKMRNRRYQVPRGPLIVVAGKQEGLIRAANMIKGVDIMSVESPNMGLLAPGMRCGRLCIFTEEAMERLAEIYGDEDGISERRGYKLPISVLTADSIDGVIKSDAIQNVVRPKMFSHQDRKKLCKRN